MRYLSVCSGIEAATVAWHHLGWKPVGFSEIEAFPSAVLAHHYPSVPNYGDMTKHEEWPIEPGTVDLLVGGTPCQSFSVAGLRRGLTDPRGGLMLTYLEIARRLRPRWVVWENVPGVLSSNGGRDFGSFLGALGELGYGWAYRVLDAQWCRTHGHPRAVPQRRRRVFVVGCLGDPAAAAAVLFERESVQRDSAPRRTKGQGAAADAEAGSQANGWPARVASTLNHAFGDKLGLEDQHALHGAPLFVPDVVGALTAKGPEGLGAPEVDAQHYVLSSGQANASITSNVAPTLDCLHEAPVLAPITVRPGSIGQYSEDNVGGTLRAQGGDYQGAESLVIWPADVAATLDRSNHGSGHPGGSNQEIFSQHGANLIPVPQPVPFVKAKRAQSVTDDETWVDGQVNPTLSLFDQGDTRATTVAVVGTDLYNGAFTGDVAATMGTPGSSVNASGPTVAFHPLQDPISSTDGSTHCMGTGGSQGHASIAVACPTLTAHNDPSRSPQSAEVTQQVAAVHAASMTVRRLTPRECERLQGFPDDYTAIPWRKKPAGDCPDGPRYKALGNSMAVNCMAWIGERIAAYEARNPSLDRTPRV